MGAHGLPVVGDRPDRGDVEAGVALLEAQRLDHRPQGGLGGGLPEERVHGAVDAVHAGGLGWP